MVDKNPFAKPLIRPTEASSRRWAYLWYVTHLIYFRPFRQYLATWANTVIWLSIGGCVMSLSGLVVGVWRYAVRARFRLKGIPAHSPYAGFMKWHHYAGLIFGLTTSTWIFSGLLSMMWTSSLDGIEAIESIGQEALALTREIGDRRRTWHREGLGSSIDSRREFWNC